MDNRWPFFTVDIELTNICGQNCSFCPRASITRPAGYIKPQLLADILAQLKTFGSRITFCGMGNPLLHPQWSLICEICGKCGLKYGLTVQAPALDPGNIARICELAPAFIEVSFPTIDSSHFSRIYPDQNLEHCLEAVEQLVIARKSNRGISITTIRTADEPLSRETTEAFWQKRGLPLRQLLCHSRGGNLHTNVVTQPRLIKSCGLFATHAFISWQGRLLACCHDLTGNTEIADLGKVPLNAAAAAKTSILQQGMPWSLCASCDEPAAARPLPDRSFPETEKARSRYLKRLCAF